MMASTEKKLFKHGGSWAVDLPMPFAKRFSDMSVVIEASPQGILIKPKTELDTMEADPLFQQFVRAIAIDAMKNPDKLHDAQDVWDHEWTDLLKGVDVGQE
jgi:virulence-associated protein VagC